MNKTIIYGNGEYARIIHQNIVAEGGLEVVAFTADRQFMKGEAFRGLPLVPFEEVGGIYPPEEFSMLVVIAFSRMRDREIMFNKAKAKGYHLENFIGVGVIVPSDLIMGENNIISEGAIIGPFGRIGDNNMIRPNAFIAHDCKIHSHNYIAPGCNIGGECEIRSLCFIGIGATLIDGVTVERETLIGAGSLVLKNTEPYSKYIGSPAKKIGEHAENGIVFERKREERRHYPRKHMDLPAFIQMADAAGGRHRAAILDISLGGIYVSLPAECFSRFQEAERGPEFEASFELPAYAEAITVACKPERAVPSRGDGCVGASFVRVDSFGYQKLRQYLMAELPVPGPGRAQG